MASRRYDRARAQLRSNVFPERNSRGLICRKVYRSQAWRCVKNLDARPRTIVKPRAAAACVRAFICFFSPTRPREASPSFSGIQPASLLPLRPACGRLGSIRHEYVNPSFDILFLVVFPLWRERPVRTSIK